MYRQSVEVCNKAKLASFYWALFHGKNVESSLNGPSLRATMNRGSWGKAKTESWSILSFISKIPTQPQLPPSSVRWPAPSQSHLSRERRRWRAAMQVIRAAAAVTTSRRGKLQLKQALCHADSYLVYHRLYQWGCDVTAVIMHPSHLIHICVLMSGARTKVPASNTPHAQPWVITSQRCFLSFTISRMAVEWTAGGKGQSHPLNSPVYNFAAIRFKCCKCEIRTA